MGKKKQRKGAPDLDDDFPEAAEATAPADTNIPDEPAATAKKQDRKKKAKKVCQYVLVLLTPMLVSTTQGHSPPTGQSQGLRLGL